MPADNEMTIDERRKYLKKLRPRYLAPDRAEKGRLLTEMALVTRLHRKSLVRLPFLIRELHPDNGSEFFNTHLVRFFGEVITGLTLSRSRPYHKNDNRFVEQKNATLIRAYLGHLRLETAEQVAPLNALYDQMWIYYNLFQPVLHLAEKRRVEGKLRRIWDQAQTPYQRLLATGVLDPTPAQQLARCYEQINPRRLRQEIYRQLAGLWESGLPQIEAA